jgi:hypothetical protein
VVTGALPDIVESGEHIQEESVALMHLQAARCERATVGGGGDADIHGLAGQTRAKEIAVQRAQNQIGAIEVARRRGDGLSEDDPSEDAGARARRSGATETVWRCSLEVE